MVVLEGAKDVDTAVDCHGVLVMSRAKSPCSSLVSFGGILPRTFPTWPALPDEVPSSTASLPANEVAGFAPRTWNIQA